MVGDKVDPGAVVGEIVPGPGAVVGEIVPGPGAMVGLGDHVANLFRNGSL